MSAVSTRQALSPASTSFEFALRAVLLLNIFDAILTSWWVATGWATEANPLMNRVLELGIGPFLFTKLLVGMAAVLILKAHHRHPLSQIGVVTILAAYVLVFMVHVSHSAERLADGTMIASNDAVEGVAAEDALLSKR